MDDAIGWIVALSLFYVTYKYFFKTSDSNNLSTEAGRTSRITSGNTFRLFPGSVSSGSVTNEEQLQQLLAMFPHIAPNSIRYELRRVRGNVQLVVERCLRDGYLPDPPLGLYPDEHRTTPVPPQSGASVTVPSTPSNLFSRLDVDHLAPKENTLESVDESLQLIKEELARQDVPRQKLFRLRKLKMAVEAKRKMLQTTP